MTITQTLTAPPTAPSRSQAKATFDENIEARLAWDATNVTELTAFASQANADLVTNNANAVIVAAAVAAADASEDICLALANYAGVWASLTGALTAPKSTYHQGVFWILTANVADVTAHTPGVSGSWSGINVSTVTTRTSNVVFGVADMGGIFRYTTGGFTQTIAASSQLPTGWFNSGVNHSSAPVTLDADSAETINGATTLVIYPGQSFTLAKSGSGTFVAVVSSEVGRMTPVSRSSNTIITASDCGKLFTYTAGGFSQTFDPCASLGSGFFCYLWHLAAPAAGGKASDVTLDPNSSETIDGATTAPLRHGMLLKIWSDGSNLFAMRIGANTTLEILTSGTSWTCPAGVRVLRGRMVGAGGGGGATASQKGSSAGSGGFIEFELVVVPGTAYTYAIGAAGTGATAGGDTTGGSGGNTTFSYATNTIQASGGAGGGGGNASTGGSGGGVSVPASYKIFGTAGAHGCFNAGASGGTPLAVASLLGNTYGAGGNGAASSGSNGGDGTQGIIILEY